MNRLSRRWAIGLLSGLLMLTGCAEWPRSPTPVLDAHFGQALNEAKRQQTVPGPVSDEAPAEGAGMPTATEAETGLQAQQRGKSGTSAYSNAR